jgi:uncharacterized phage protein (TIGR02220 family)
MKWFKHDTDCYLSEGLCAFQEKTGWEGYGRWFRLLEIVAAKMDKSDRHSATYSDRYWQKQLGFYHRRSLIHWLEIAVNLLRISFECKDNLITIYIPNLLKKRDEYSKKSGQTPDNVPPKIEEVRNKIKEEPCIVEQTEKEIPYKEIIDHLNNKTGQHYRATSASTREHISARWREGHTLDDFKRCIDNMTAKWKDDPKMCAYLRPATLFNKEKFDGYVNQIITEKEKRGLML